MILLTALCMVVGQKPLANWVDRSNYYLYYAGPDLYPPVTWGSTFDDCYKSCFSTKGCVQFGFTNATKYHPGGTQNTGCSLFNASKPTTPCKGGDCGNWDLFRCPAANAQGCNPAVQPPPPPPAPPPFAFSPALGNHMVLQRGVLARIWGTAPPSAAITLLVTGGSAGASAGEETYHATADSNGDWEVDLTSRAEDKAPSTITATVAGTASTATPIVLTDILFGDVWGCHGQSNMQFGLGGDINATEECEATNKYPDIRIMTFTQGQKWSVANSNTTCTAGVKAGFSAFSAVCWYFGKDVYHSLDGSVPIGLVSSNVGGTAVEKWSGPDAVAKCNQTGVVQQSSLWTPYIVPLLPMQMSGWIWYQAESNVACSVSWPWMPGLNCGIGCNTTVKHCNASQTGCADFYSCQFPSMITDWRAKWNGGEEAIAGRPRPFLFVELAPYTEGAGEPYDQSTALVRDAQLAALALPHVGMAAAYDYGDMGSPLGNIHPRYKAPVGQRLSYAARALGYGEKIAYKNPAIVSGTATASSITLKFDANVELRTPTKLSGCQTGNPVNCGWLTVNGVNQTSIAVSADGATVVVNIAPTAAAYGGGGRSGLWEVAYLQADWPVPFIYLEGSGTPGLPAAPFKLSVPVAGTAAAAAAGM